MGDGRAAASSERSGETRGYERWSPDPMFPGASTDACASDCHLEIMSARVSFGPGHISRPLNAKMQDFYVIIHCGAGGIRSLDNEAQGMPFYLLLRRMRQAVRCVLSKARLNIPDHARMRDRMAPARWFGEGRGDYSSSPGGVDWSVGPHRQTERGPLQCWNQPIDTLALVFASPINIRAASAS